MGLTEQQKLYILSDYYLLLMIGDDEVCGIIGEYTVSKIDLDKLRNCGFYLKKIDFDDLYIQAIRILEDEKLI